MRNRTLVWKVAAMLAATLVVGACGGEPQARSITLTFVRNAQSQANADGIIETGVPGPGLSSDGKGQAQQLVHQIVHKDVDSIYSSGAAEAQETAAPLASELGKQVEILPGLAPINAGWYNGKPESMASSTYMLAPADWINGDVQNKIPGSTDGKDFNEQFTKAIKKIYDGGHSKPLVISQGTAIMTWTLMNVKNPKTSLLNSHPLPNLGRVVITGNPTNGWTVLDWDGIREFTS
jgi:broad specificity phosphatase PhoE